MQTNDEELIIAAGVLVQKFERAIHLLESIATEPTHLAVGGNGVEERVANWPVTGQARLVARDRSRGGTLTVPAATTTDITGHDPARAGLSIVNSGANPCTLYLSRAGDQTGGSAVIYVAASGGSWDGRLGGESWAGPVSALSTLGTTLVWGAL